MLWANTELVGSMFASVKIVSPRLSLTSILIRSIIIIYNEVWKNWSIREARKHRRGHLRRCLQGKRHTNRWDLRSKENQARNGIRGHPKHCYQRDCAAEGTPASQHRSTRKCPSHWQEVNSCFWILGPRPQEITWHIGSGLHGHSNKSKSLMG